MLTIQPQIIIEPFLQKDFKIPSEEIEVYCFRGKAKLIVKLYGGKGLSVYNENLEQIDDIFGFNEKKVVFHSDNNLEKSITLSEKLAKKINFVRIDWMLYNKKLYFEEMTFSPYSGMIKFKNNINNLKLGALIL